MNKATKFMIAAALPAVLAGCGASTASLSTGSLFGSNQGAPAAQAAAVETPSIRAAQVGAVSARAAKCGYNFDPARLKSGFLASEMSNGASAQDMAKIEREYDTIRAKVAAAVAADPDFCSESKTRAIKADLTRHLAGDYSQSEERKKVIDERLLASGPRTREVLNPDFVQDKWASKTKRVEE
jgi:lipase chaperone LimK